MHVHTSYMSRNAETIGERIRFARTTLRTNAGLPAMPQRVVADALGVSIPSVSEWERNTFQPGREKMQPLADVLCVNVLWLEFGIGLPERVANNTIGAATIPNSGGVPMVDAYTAIHGLEEAIANSTVRTPTYFHVSPRAYSILIWDNSNTVDNRNGYTHGDRITLDPDAEPQPSDMVLAKSVDGRPLFGELRISRDGQTIYRIHHINPAFGDERISGRDAIIGVMTEHTRPAKR